MVWGICWGGGKHGCLYIIIIIIIYREDVSSMKDYAMSRASPKLHLCAFFGLHWGSWRDLERNGWPKWSHPTDELW